MPDRLDEVLGSLGEGTPFPVDWEEYERELLVRLARRERARRLRATLALAASAVAGAAAAILAAVVVAGPPERALGTPPSAEGRDRAAGEVGSRVARREVPARAEAVDRARPRPADHPVTSRRARGSAILFRGGSGPAPGGAEAPPLFARIASRAGGRGEIRFDGFTRAGDESPGYIVALAAAE